MTELGDDYREHREYQRKKREREGWISNRYKTEESRQKSVANSHRLNDEIDGETMKTLKKLKIKAVRKGASSFQL